MGPLIEISTGLDGRIIMRIVTVNEYEKRVDLQRSGGWSYFSRDIQWA